MNKYGWSFTAHKTGGMLVVNGYMFSTFKVNGRRKYTFGQNIWRKTKTEING